MHNRATRTIRADAGMACHLFLISAAMVMKACSTLVAFLALVSKKGMPISSANACTQRTATHQIQVLQEKKQWAAHCLPSHLRMASAKEYGLLLTLAV